MKAFVLTCLLAVATASPQLSHYGLLGSPLGYHGYSPLVLSPIAPLVHYPSSGAVVPADAPDVALAKIAHAQAHHEALSRGKRSPAYYGPPAPLNSDGTVAQTPEVAAAASYQSAAHQQELRRLADAAALAAAHPDTTSPQQSWDNGNQWRSAAPQQNWNAAPQQSWNAAPQQQSWNAQPQPQQWARSYNPAATQPAPLNPDGTVAQTKEFQAIASAHAAAHQQLAAPQPYYGRRKRSVALNPDGSVAPTPEVAAATAAHLAAHAAARGYAPAPLAYSAPLTYGAPLALSPFSLYSGLPFYGRYAAHVPAPLNHDGTVAHTPEYLAVAASHAAAHHHALSRARRSVALNPDGTVAPTPEVQAATAAHYAALARAGGAHYYGAPAVGYAAPYTTYAYHHSTAPLNPDGTVAETPEVAHLAAAHRAAQAQQLGLLAQQEALARASGDYSGDYSGSYAGYSGYAAPVAYAGSYAHQPAPLNPDGTVAHTPEYRAIAASHAAAHYAH